MTHSHPDALSAAKLMAQLDAAMTGLFTSAAASEDFDRIPVLLQQLLDQDDLRILGRETLVSLLSFFQNSTGLDWGAGDLDQLRLLWESLRPDMTGRDGAAPRLVMPITRSGPNHSNRVVSLLIESRAIQALLQAALVSAGYELSPLDSIQSLLDMPEEARPTAIIADLSRCRDDPNSVRILEQVRAKQVEPVHLFCLSGADDFEARLEAVRLGATRFLKKPVDVVKLLAILNGVTARSPREPFRVLFVDDDKALTQLYSAALTESGCETRSCNKALHAPEAVQRFSPDVIVTDVYMPGCNGLELAALLRQDESLADTPILFLSSENNINRQMVALDLGGDDFLTKPVALDVLASAVLARAKRARMLKRIRRELEAARAEAEQASQSKSRFMADMNHELKVPLNTVLGYAQLMVMELTRAQDDCKPELAASLGKSLGYISDAGQHQLELINEILELSKAEAGRIEIALEDVRLAPLVDQCLELLSPLADKTGVRCERLVAPAIVVRADPQRLKQILLNLISNAIKYNHAAGQVQVLCQGSDKDGVQVMVRDTGRGIEPRLQGELFQPFSRLHMNQSEEIEGTGLGLALVKSLVEAMAGQIGVNSQVGVGSEFWFILPAAGR